MSIKPEVLERYTTDAMPGPFHCNKVDGSCGKEFAKPASLFTHVNRAHTKRVVTPSGQRHGKRRKHCPHCPKMLSAGAGMARHMRSAHPETLNENGANGNGKHQLEVAKRIPRQAPTPHVIEFGRTVVYCPRCGTNIPIVQRALDFAESQGALAR